MTIRRLMGVAAMACAISAGCGNGDLPGEVGRLPQEVGSYGGGTYYNGQGVYVSLASTTNEFGMAQTQADWHLLGFSDSGGKVYAVWKQTDGAGSDVDAQTQVGTAVQGASTFDVLRVEAADATLGATNVRVDLRDRKSGQPLSKSGAALEGLIFKITDPTGGPAGTFSLRFHTPVNVTPDTSPLYAISLDFWSDGTPSQVIGYCRTDAGTEGAVFMTGAAIHPLTAQRTLDTSHVNVSCASGSIVACQIWGYRPWVNGGDAHQACVQMKRAAYCGAVPYTNYGHIISVRDSLTPHANDAFGTTQEAYWGPSGALCLDSRRDPDISFPGCATPLPACDSVPANWLTRSSF